MGRLIIQNAGSPGYFKSLFSTGRKVKKAANGRMAFWKESLHFEIVCPLPASITSVTQPSWVFHPLPRDTQNWVPSQETTRGRRELLHQARKRGGRPGLGAEVWAKSTDLRGHTILKANPAWSSCGPPETFACD